MKAPPESLKAFCNRMASAAASDEGARLARMLRLMGVLERPFHSAGEQAEAGGMSGRKTAPASSDRVGIWERENRDGETWFVRRMDMAKEWRFWANLGRIGPKGGKRRVVLIGESVARGYLYDPQFTPAMVLQAILERHMGGGVEVIDLARTDLGLEVGDLAKSALQLLPDAVVIFSGNNWRAALTAAEIPLIDSVLSEGISGLKRLAEEQLAARVRKMVGEVSSVYRAKGIPLVWLVPEFNLGDWRDPVTNAPHLPGTGNRDWLEHLQRARRAFDDGDLQQASESARRMVEIDQGVCVAGLYILAECSRRAADHEAERRYLELARDAVIWDPSREVSPRTFGVVLEALRSEASRHGSFLVDLPQVFREHLGEAVPDRRMFLDYCHLTAAGMRVAMAAAASPVLQALEGVEVPWRDLVDERLTPGREVEASAAFLAAIHNAHWWQADDIVRHFCSVSARASATVVQVMTRFIEIQTRVTPMLMGRAAEEITSFASHQIQHYLLHNYQQLDRLLIDAVTGALQGIGIEARERLENLRREERSLARGPIDLLDYYYSSSSLQPQETMWVMPGLATRYKENHFYKAYWSESRFVFVAEAGSPVRLRLTCRLPGPAPIRGSIVLALNDHPQAQIEMGDDWETWDVVVPGEAVRGGVNEITIRWPLPEFPGRQALDALCTDSVNLSFPELFPCFGEIHAFVAADGRSPETFSATVR